MILALLCAFALFMLLYPMYQLYDLLVKIDRTKNFKEVHAVVKDARVANVTSKMTMFLFKSSSFFYAEAMVDNILIGYDKATLYPSNNHHQRALIAKLKKGDTVTIHYNPEHPEQGVMLNPRNHIVSSLVFRVAFYAAVVLIGFYYFVKG